MTDGARMACFYLGVHRGRWLEDHRFHGVPLFLTYNLLSQYRRHGDAFPKGIATDWALDSGAYTEITTYGEWRDDPDTFGGRVYRFLGDVGRPPDFVAPQDWPCEPAALAASGLTVRDHQELTIDSYLWCIREFPHAPWMPVIQGWTVPQYLDHMEMYRAAGVDLAAEPRVGLGSVCRRDSTAAIAAVVHALWSRGIRLHGFGVKRDGLAAVGHMLASADSMAWSATARRSRIKLPACTHPGPCNNCPDYALTWRRDTLAALDHPQQGAFPLDFTPAA